MYSASPARDPLFRGREPHERYLGQDNFYGTDPTPNQPSYQPPRLPIGTSNGNIDANSNENANPPPNPLLWDDDAFIKAAESLLLKRKLAALSATKYIYSKMDPLERSQFAAAYSRRYQRMPMFPASDETVLQRWMRHIEDDFGDAFLQVVVVDSVSPPPPQIPVVDPRHMARQEPNHSLLQSIPVVGPQSNPNEQREWSTNNSQTNQHQHRQPPSPMQQERPVYYNDSTSAQLPRRKYRGTKSPIRRDKLEPMQQHQKQQRIAPTNVAFVEAYTPTSILRKSRLGVDSVAQIMEVLPPANPSISEIAPSTQRPGTSSVMKLQSTTRQSLMQEIAYVHRLLTTMTNTDGRCSHTNNNDRDLAYYTEHLFILKEQLRRLSEDEGIKYDGSEANLFMRAVQNLNADESVVEMDQIVGPAPIVSIRNIERDSDRRDDRLRSNSPRLLLMPHRLSERNVPSPANPKRDEVQTHSKTEQKWSRRDDEAAHASIPKVVSFERSPTCSYAEQWNDDGMSNSIVDRATSDLIGLTTAIIKNDAPPVQMVAPANLPGGYQIDAQLNDESFRVTVPEGGVSIGQTFAAKRVDGTTTARYDGDKKWKAGLFDCLAHGIAHPIFCNSFFCPQSKSSTNHHMECIHTTLVLVSETFSPLLTSIAKLHYNNNTWQKLHCRRS